MASDEIQSPGTPGTKKTKQAKRRKPLTRENWGVIRRTLVYAWPFRGQIVFALFIGMVSAMLTAASLLMLIPVLQLIFENHASGRVMRVDEAGEVQRVPQEEVMWREDNITQVTNTIERLRQKAEEDPSFISRFQYRSEVRLQRIKLAWYEWVYEVEEKAIYYMAVVLLIAVVLKGILFFISQYMLQKSFFLAVLRLKTDLYEKCLHLDMPHFRKFTSGDLISRLNNDIRAVRTVFTTMMSEAVLAPFNIIFLLMVLLYLNWALTLIVIFGLPPIIFPLMYMARKLRQMGRRDEEEDARILDFTQETIQGLMIVKAYGAERRELRKFRLLSRELARRQIRRERIRLYSQPFVEIVGSLAIAIILCVGGYLILKSDSASMTPTEFITFLFALTRFYPPVKKVANTIVKMQKAVASADRIFEVLDTPSIVMDKPGAKAIAPISDRIVFEGVTFGYDDEKPPVLKDFSLEIPKGRKLAMVGRTGAGKSTVARLLPRLYDPQEGRIIIDGVDIRDVSLRSLRSQMAVVSQETILFNDTVAANIRYANPRASTQDVERAARAAYAHEFIEHLPKGYKTVIGERGGQLSGGQRQRLAIARALLSNAPILILDEATSALDNESEAIVQHAIEALMENRTVIMIAHRLSTVRKADEILVLTDGKIVERGTYQGLLAKGGEFHRLVQQAELLDK
ncbi:MAG: ABC transporter ATP-binding protein [Candidatus Sumerlaeia bacterium]|nr:ABC transporter ATP-binding protein [Candidatus Sumerlaeia bacterium]